MRSAAREGGQQGRHPDPRGRLAGGVPLRLFPRGKIDEMQIKKLLEDLWWAKLEVRHFVRRCYGGWMPRALRLVAVQPAIAIERAELDLGQPENQQLSPAAYAANLEAAAVVYQATIASQAATIANQAAVIASLQAKVEEQAARLEAQAKEFERRLKAITEAHEEAVKNLLRKIEERDVRIEEQDARIGRLEARVGELEQENAAMKAYMARNHLPWPPKEHEGTNN